jgi:hypothetical protein
LRGNVNRAFTVREPQPRLRSTALGRQVAAYATTDGNFRYAVDMEGYGALQLFTEEKLVVHSNQIDGASRAGRVGDRADNIFYVCARSDRNFRMRSCRRPRRAGGR